MACLGLELKIHGVDRTALLIHETLSISQTNDGLNSTCEFDLLDQAVIREGVWTVQHTRVGGPDVITGYITFFPQTKVEVEIINPDDATVYFKGILSRVKATHMGQLEIIPGFTEPESQVLHCEAHDFNQMLEEFVIDVPREYSGQDELMIDDIFNEFVDPYDDPGDPINYDLFVNAAPYAFDIINFDGITVRAALDAICAQSKCIWFMDYDKNLHYGLPDKVESFPPITTWHLSDVPDAGDPSFAYFDDITKEKDATNLVNMVFVVGGIVSLWFSDADSIDTYGEHRAIVRDTSLIDIDDIEAKGNAVLEKLKDPVITYTLKTYGAGAAPPQQLRAGKHIRVVSAFYDLDDTYLIRSLRITFPVDGTPVYEITWGGLDSSASGSARRAIADEIHFPPIAPGQLPLAARGWVHDLEFSATDHEIVEWTAGTITTASGQTFAIAPGANTDVMAAVTYVYLDIELSRTSLRTTVNPENTIGGGRILIAVCVNDTAAVPTLAMYQVFGGGAGTTVFLHADNVAANCITANEIYGNSLEVVAANIGILTIEAAGEIRAYTDDWDVDADGFRITHDEIAGQLNGVDQINLSAADGKLRAGIGAVILDEDGIKTIGAGAAGTTRTIRFIDNSAGEKMVGGVLGDWGGGAGQATTWLYANRIAGDPWPANVQVILAATDAVAATDVRLFVQSGGVVGVTGSAFFGTNADVRIGGGLYVGQLGVDPDPDDIWVDGDIRVVGGIYVGQLGVDPPVDDIWVDNDIRVDGGVYIGGLGVDPPIGNLYVAIDARIGGGLYVGQLGVDPAADNIYCDGRIFAGYGDGWELGDFTLGVQTDTGWIRVRINGTLYRLLAVPD